MTIVNNIKTLGIVCNALPAQLYYLMRDGFIATSTGNQLCIYDITKLRKRFTSKVFDFTIKAFCCCTGSYSNISIIASENDDVFVYCRYELLWKSRLGDFDIRKIEQHEDYLLVFGAERIASLHLKTGELIKIISDIDSTGRFISGLGYAPISHYYGKINTYLVGGADCVIRGVDVITGALRFSFECVIKYLENKAPSSQKSSASRMTVESYFISCVEFTSVGSDAVLIAVSPMNDDSLNSFILLCDLSSDEVLLDVEIASSAGKVNCLAFKDVCEPTSVVDNSIDCSNKRFAYAGTSSGDVAVITLAANCSVNILSCAHTANQSISQSLLSGVTSIDMVSPGGTSGCIFYTSGTDNSLKMWTIMDVESAPTILKQRSGLYGTVQKLKLSDNELFESGKLLVATKSRGVHSSATAGFVSIINEAQNVAFPVNNGLKTFNAKHRILRRLPDILDIDICLQRNFDWPNIVTVHKKMHEVLIWSSHNKALTGLCLEAPYDSKVVKDDGAIFSIMSEIKSLNDPRAAGSLRKSFASACCISSCGHFSFVGYENGTTAMFNLQSRRFVGHFKAQLYEEENTTTAAQEKLMDKAYEVLHESNALKSIRKKQLLRAQLKDQKAAVKANSRTEAEAQEFSIFDNAVGFIQPYKTNFIACASRSSTLVKILNIRKLCVVSDFDARDIIAETGSNSDTILAFIASDELTISNFSLNGSVAIISLYSAETKKSLAAIINIATKVAARTYGPFDGRISDIAISPVCNWLICNTSHTGSYSEECQEKVSSLRIFDVVSNCLIEWIEFDFLITSLAFDTSGSYLITANDFAAKCRDNVYAELQGASRMTVWAMKPLFTCRFNLKAFTSEKPVFFRDSRFLEEVRCNMPASKGIQLDMCSLETVQEDKLGLLTSQQWNSTAIRRLLNWDHAKSQASNVDNAPTSGTIPFFLFDETASISKTSRPSTGHSRSDSEAARPAKMDTRLDRLQFKEFQDKLAAESYSDLLEIFIAESIINIHFLLTSLMEVSSVVSFLKCLNAWIAPHKEVNFVQAIVQLFFVIHGDTLKSICFDELITIDDSGDNNMNLKVEVMSELELTSQQCVQQWGTICDEIDELICNVKRLSLMQFE